MDTYCLASLGSLMWPKAHVARKIALRLVVSMISGTRISWLDKSAMIWIQRGDRRKPPDPLASLFGQNTKSSPVMGEPDI